MLIAVLNDWHTDENGHCIIKCDMDNEAAALMLNIAAPETDVPALCIRLTQPKTVSYDIVDKTGNILKNFSDIEFEEEFDKYGHKDTYHIFRRTVTSFINSIYPQLHTEREDTRLWYETFSRDLMAYGQYMSSLRTAAAVNFND